MALKKFTPSMAAPIQRKDKSGEAEAWKKMVLDYLNGRPRSTQTTIGPSGAGNPCDRSLVGAMSGFEGSPDPNPWLAGVGVSVHVMLAQMLEDQNMWAEANGQEPEWLIEQDLEIRPPAIPRGSCDAYNIKKKMVVDHKILGKTTLEDLMKNGMTETYRTQLHIYGLGLEQMGYEVKSVMLVGYPRNANPNLPFLHEAVFLKEPYDRDLAVAAVDRVEALYLRARELKANLNLKKLQLVKSSPGKACHFCPFRNNKAACPDGIN